MRFHVVLLLVVILVLFIAKPTTSSRIRRVVNGIVSQPGQWPFMVALHRITYHNIYLPYPFPVQKQRSYKFFCGGMVWDSQTILTAAHCVAAVSANRTAVYLGHVDRTVTDENYLFNVKEIITHEYYDDDTVKNDIALIRLVKPINFLSLSQKIAPVRPLRPSQLVDPDRCVILGWGQTGTGRSSSRLREAEVYLEGCSPRCAHESQTVEAGDYDADKGTCLGDSGGPLLCPLANDSQSYSLVGITSMGSRYCLRGMITRLSVFTYVPHYLRWIKQNAGELQLEARTED